MNFNRFFLLSLLLLLSGCSYLYGDKGIVRNRETDYLNAKSIPPLQIPPGLSSSTIQAHYPVPDRNYPDSAKKINLEPPLLNTSGK